MNIWVELRIELRQRTPAVGSMCTHCNLYTYRQLDFSLQVCVLRHIGKLLTHANNYTISLLSATQPILWCKLFHEKWNFYKKEENCNKYDFNDSCTLYSHYALCCICCCTVCYISHFRFCCTLGNSFPYTFRLQRYVALSVAQPCVYFYERWSLLQFADGEKILCNYCLSEAEIFCNCW